MGKAPPSPSLLVLPPSWSSRSGFAQKVSAPLEDVWWLWRPRHYVIEAACLLVVEFFLAKIHMGEIHKFLSFGLLVGQRHVNRKAQRYKCNGKSSKDW
uniref:Uncharacterized protein n=2 Tax=Oryza sativa subsp. japonica TaxID=39947 RepID=Q10JP0_ORYSJ|nr:hypothetical protein Os03g29990 [Oryza sativa Japonica Group]ABF96588.1 hypothetical protein LOC_Os03g29990 [Oryza sativa Japonica Group]